MKRRRVFWAVAAVLTALWAIANWPRVEDREPDASYTTRRAGWPDRFARWSVRPDSGEVFYSSFDTFPFVFDLALLAVPVVATWFLVRPRGPTQDEASTRPRRPTPGKVPTRRPK